MIHTYLRKNPKLFICFLAMLVSMTYSHDTSNHSIKLEFDMYSNTSLCTEQNNQHFGQKHQGLDSKKEIHQPQSTICSKQTPISWMTNTSQLSRDRNSSQTNETIDENYKQRKVSGNAYSILFNASAAVLLLLILKQVNYVKQGLIVNSFFSLIQNCSEKTKKLFKKILNFLVNPYKNLVKKDQIDLNNDASQPINTNDVWTDLKQQLNHNEQCAICIHSNTTIRLNCNHIYHYSCILNWIVQKGHCPLCIRQISRMTLFCKKCLMKKKDINIQKVENQLNLLDQYCENCS